MGSSPRSPSFRLRAESEHKRLPSPAILIQNLDHTFDREPSAIAALVLQTTSPKWWTRRLCSANEGLDVLYLQILIVTPSSGVQRFKTIQPNPLERRVRARRKSGTSPYILASTNGSLRMQWRACQHGALKN